MIDPETPLEERPRGSILGHVNVVMLTYLVDGVLAFATGILIARALGPEGRGAYGLFVVSAAFGQILLGLGIGNAAIYYINRREMSVRDVVTAAHAVTIWAATATAFILVVLTVLQTPIDAAIGAVRDSGDFTVEGMLAGGGISPWLLVGAVTALLYWNLMRLVLQAESRFVDLAFATISQQAILLGAIALLFAFADPTPTQISLCLIAATGAAGLFSFGRVGVRYLDVAALVREPFANVSKLARFGVQGEAGNLLQLLNYRLDQYIVRAYVGLAAVGVYAVSVSMTEAIFVMANAVALVLLPRLTAEAAEAEWMAPLAARNTMLVAAAGAAVLAVVAPVLVPLAFGDRYRDSVEPLWLLLPGTVALAGSKVLTSYIFSQGKPIVNTAITAASLVVTLGANIALVPAFGVNGAAVASSLAYVAHFGCALFAYGRISGRSPLAAIVPGREDVRLYASAWEHVMTRIGRRPAIGPDRPQRV